MMRLWSLASITLVECRLLLKRCTSRSANGLSYFHNPGTEPLHYLTIGQLSRRAAQRWPDTDAFVCVPTSTQLSFTQVDHQLAVGLLDLGLEPGDRIGICSPNSIQWYLTALAAAKAGLILVSMNSSYLTHELRYCLEKVGVRALITDESFQSKQFWYRMLCDILPGLSSRPLDSRVSSSDLPHLDFLIINSNNRLPGTFSLSDMFERCDNLQRLEEVEESLRPEQIGNIQFTSGTTGKPKAVPLSHFALVNNSYSVGKRLGLDKKHYRLLAQAPFFHVLGYVVGMLSSLHFGTTLVLPSPTFNARSSCQAIKTEKCTVLIGTPTMYVDLCSHVSSLSAEEQLQHQSPELALSGGALCAPKLFRKMKNTFFCDKVVNMSTGDAAAVTKMKDQFSGRNTPLYSIYGLTETTCVTFQSKPEDSESLITSTVGCISEHVETRVVDSEGLTVPLGSPGELWIRSYNNMAGYWEDEESTAKVMTSDRWLKTGDKFVLSEGGYGEVVGRIKDMIIRGGENISPKEVEELLVTHPYVLEAQVYGVNSERLGEEVGCSLRLQPGCAVTEQEVRDFCKGKIAHFKVPKYVEFLEEFPKTGSGKVQKFKIREAVEMRLCINK